MPRELGPIAGDRAIVVEGTPIRQYGGAGGGNTLAGRGQHEQRVAVYRPGLSRIGQTSPGVDHEVTVQVGGNLQADFGAFGHQRFENLSYLRAGEAVARCWRCCRLHGWCWRIVYDALTAWISWTRKYT